MGSRAPRPVVRKAKTMAAQATVQARVTGRSDGFLELASVERAEHKPVREKVVRKLRALHPMD